jgi:XTP/dITP diphosphohydrolase
VAAPDEGRITLLLVSPRTAPGLLAWPAWERLREADLVLGAEIDPAWRAALADAGVAVSDVQDVPVAQRAGRLVEESVVERRGRDVVWWGGPDGDPGLTDALADHLSRRAVAGHPPQVEVLAGAHDVAGARLLDLVAVMDTLRSPGGCPWDAAQTHTSLLPYLLEETHEVIEAVEAGDRALLAEELGDLLLQVVFHARLAEEDAAAPFGIDEVAAGIVAKLVRRHPHVFGDDAASIETPDDVESSWEQLKQAEKPARAGFEGIPATLPALARAQKMLGRLERSEQDAGAAVDAVGDGVARTLLRTVLSARRADVDAEAALRAALAELPEP